MKAIGIAAVCIALAGSMGAASADPWKDESGKGRERGYSRHDDGYRGHGYEERRRERKVEYDDGRCKVERKWGKGGEYKEKVKCRGGARGYPAYGYRY